MIGKTCVHDEKWDECVFGCKLWEYTRTGRKHYIDDDEYPSYNDGPYWNTWVIADTCGAMTGIAGSKGYDLYHRGKKIKHGKTVKELKKVVADAMADGRGIENT